jgi:hypothetical protein
MLSDTYIKTSNSEMHTIFSVISASTSRPPGVLDDGLSIRNPPACCTQSSELSLLLVLLTEPAEVKPEAVREGKLVTSRFFGKLSEAGAAPRVMETNQRSACCTG